MFKRITPLLFVFLYMLAMLRPIAPFVEYAINQDYIAKFLCINQDKPEMQCNGKCHLYKEVKKQQEETPVSLQISLKDYPIGFVKILNIKKKKEVNFIKKENYTYSKNYSYLFSEVIFHPPI
ncbi:hypothetical protein [Polaribacter ponticola]|uniref:Uncharacterized protein n=1 Tax=Polaribacter ponticola TaxID=2978475 RepID=A0ABT5SAI7_9FLAO|nr:hypothetical protein [Polaribacter sp. MSW5]MDD7915132.1 hypothetical protein [Polaribacter sp. MSW5]